MGLLCPLYCRRISQALGLYCSETHETGYESEAGTGAGMAEKHLSLHSLVRKRGWSRDILGRRNSNSEREQLCTRIRTERQNTCAERSDNEDAYQHDQRNQQSRKSTFYFQSEIDQL